MSDFFSDLKTGDTIPTYKYFIGGEWKTSASGNTLEVRSPIDGSLVGRIQACTKEEAAAVVEDAAKSWQAWNDLTVSRRADILHKVDDLMFEHKDELINLLMLEIGKTHASAEEEVVRTAELIHYFNEEGRRFYGEIIWGDSFPGYSKDKICLVYREPYGVILCIGPFNYPLNLSASKIAPALITGNSAVFKPPLQGSISCLFMTEIFRKGGVPPGVLNTITGIPSEIGDVLASHPQVAMVSFTGSTKTGKYIAHTAGLKKLMLELGGKDAAIVLKDADLELTTKQIVKGGFSYSGQRCTAMKRVLPVPEIADRLVEMIVESVLKLKVGDPREKDVFIGPVISDASADYVQGLIDDAIARGAKVLCGNKRNGRLIWPTVLDNVTLNMRVAWEEPFGPVLPIIRVKSIDEAIQIANRSEYGLQSAVFTQDVDAAFYVGRKLEVGTVNVNGADSRGPDHFPFLGVKNSGMETQGVHYSIEAMTRTKAITLNLRNPKG